MGGAAGDKPIHTHTHTQETGHISHTQTPKQIDRKTRREAQAGKQADSHAGNQTFFDVVLMWAGGHR